jgi:preprotein translocase subunit SecY
LQEGSQGREINQYTRYGTVGLRPRQGLGVAKFLEDKIAVQHQVVPNPVSCSGDRGDRIHRRDHLLMWLGEQITERGIGGISLIIFIGIVADTPRTPEHHSRALFGRVPRLHAVARSRRDGADDSVRDPVTRASATFRCICAARRQAGREWRAGTTSVAGQHRQA